MSNYPNEDQAFWHSFTEKYANQNPIARYLLNGFFSKITTLIRALPIEYKLLEVGCGPGESTLRINSMLNGQSFEASEVDSRFIKAHLENNFPIKVTQESVYKLERKDNEFDCVIMLEVLEHLEDYHKALKELFRVAKHSVIISVPNEPLWRILNCIRGKYLSDFGNTPGHINHWNKNDFIKLLEQYGTVEVIFTPTPWLIAHCKAQ